MHAMNAGVVRFVAVTVVVALMHFAICVVLNQWVGVLLAGDSGYAYYVSLVLMALGLPLVMFSGASTTAWWLPLNSVVWGILAGILARRK